MTKPPPVRFLGSVVGVLLLVSAPNAFGQVGSDAVDDPVVLSIAATYGVDLGTAKTWKETVDEANAIQQRLVAEHPTRFAGMFVDYQPEFRVTVLMTGPADRILDSYTRNPAIVAAKAQIPLKALQNRQQALGRRMLAAGMRNYTSEVDVRGNRVKFIVPDVDQAKRAGGPVSEEEGGDVIYEAGTFTDVVTATVLGGDELRTATFSGMRDQATAGFVVVKGTIRGILSAAHFNECTNMPSGCVKNSQVSNSAGIPFIHQGQMMSGNNDYEWYSPSTAGHSLTNKIYYSNTQMSITGTRDPTLFALDTVVCKQGFDDPSPTIGSGYTCGQIKSTSQEKVWQGVTGYYVRVKCTNPCSPNGTMAEGGDSGGPVFGANTAYGLVHSKITGPAEYAGQMMFMPIPRISGLGLSIATTAPSP